MELEPIKRVLIAQSDLDNINKFLKNFKFTTLNKLDAVISESNFPEVLETFRDIAIENHLKSYYDYAWRINNKTDPKVKDKNPDFILDPMKETYIEYKTFIKVKGPNELAEIQTLWKNRYNGIKVKIIVLDDLLGDSREKFYNKSDIYGILKKLKPYLLKAYNLFKSSIKTDDDTELRIPLNELIDKVSSHIKINDKDYDTNDFKKFADSTDEALDKIADGVIAETTRSINFVEKNMLSAEDQTKYLILKNISECTIKNEPFNRDANQVKLTNGDKYGYKANAISSFLIDKKYSEFNGQEEFVIPEDYRFNDLLKPLLRFCSLSEQNRNKLGSINELRRTLAFVKTQNSKEDIIKLSEMFNVPANSYKVEEAVKDTITKLSNELSLEFDGTVKFHNGKLVSLMDDEVRKKLKINVNETNMKLTDEEKMDRSIKRNKELHVKDYMSIINNVFKDSEDNKIRLPNLKNMYGPSSKLNKIIDQLEASTNENVNRTFKSDGFNSSYRYANQVRTVLTNTARFEDKGKKGKELIFFKDPVSNAYMLSTPSPNDITSGIIMCCYKGVVNEEHLKSIGHDYDVFDIKYSSEKLIVSKPFRLNRKAMVAVEETFIGALSLILHMNSLTDKIYDDNLIWSLTLNFYREIIWVLEVLYIIYKNVFNKGTLGAVELKKKTDLSKMNIKDVRTATILHRIKNGFKSMIDPIQQRLKLNLSFTGIVEPVLNYNLTSQASLQSIIYLKQLPPKDDGYDVVTLMNDFFQDEMDYQNLYAKSKFNKNNLKLNSILSNKDFADKLFTEEGTGMVELSYMPQAVYWTTRKMCENAIEKGTSKEHLKDWYMPAVNTGKSSKVVVLNNAIKIVEGLKDSSFKSKNTKTSSSSEIFGNEKIILEERSKKGKEKMRYTDDGVEIIDEAKFEKKINEFIDDDFDANKIHIEDMSYVKTRNDFLRKQFDEIINKGYIEKDKVTLKSAYEGLRTMDLTEALLYEHKLIRMLAEKTDFFDEFIDKKGTKWSDRQLSLLEMALFQTIIYPKGTIVLMNDKVQVGYGKRAFQMQTLYSRNWNKVCDSLFRSLLVSDESDIILEPGPKKNIKIQKMMTDMNTNLGDALYTYDAAKFGDMFLVEVMKIQILAVFDSGLITEAMKRNLLYWLEVQENRLVLLFHAVVKALKKLEKKKMLTDIDNRRYLKFKSAHYTIMLNKSIQSWIKDLGVFDMLTEARDNNIGFIKEVGGVLGVFNMQWSADASCINILKKVVWKKFSHSDIFKGATHSDDAGDITKIRLKDDMDVYDKVNTKNISFWFDRIFVNKTSEAKIFVEDSKLFVSTTSNSKFTLADETALLKLHLAWHIYISRMFSIRPSLSKYGFGYVFEILQQIHSSSKEIYVPLARYLTVLGKEGTATSYAEELDSVGKIYDYAINGGTATMVHTLIKIINFAVRYKYGMIEKEVGDIDFKLPPELAGYWYAIPGHIVNYGFSANEVRLLYRAERENDVRDIYKITLNTDDIWKQKMEIKPTEDKKGDSELFDAGESNFEAIWRSITSGEKVNNVDNKEEDNIEGEGMIRGSFDHRKKHCIVYSKDMRTSKAKFRIEKLFNEDIESVLKNKKNISTSDVVNSMLLILQTPSSSFVRKLLSFLNKFTSASYRMKYLRIPVEIKMIQRLGYDKRLFKNPFSEVAKKFTSDESSLTFSEIRLNCLKLVGTEVAFNNEFANKGYSLIRKIYAPYLNPLLSIDDVEFTVIGDRLSARLIDNFMLYVEFQTKQLFDIKPDFILAVMSYIFEREILKLSIEETSLYIFNFELLNDDKFFESEQIIKNLLIETGILDSKLISRSRLLTNLFILRPIESVMKCWVGKDRFESMMTDNYSSFERAEIKINSLLTDQIDTFELSKLSVKTKVRTKILAISAMEFAISNNVSISNPIGPITIDPIDNIRKVFFLRKKRLIDYSGILCDLILATKMNKADVRVFRSFEKINNKRYDELSEERKESIMKDVSIFNLEQKRKNSNNRREASVPNLNIGSSSYFETQSNKVKLKIVEDTNIFNILSTNSSDSSDDEIDSTEIQDDRAIQREEFDDSDNKINYYTFFLETGNLFSYKLELFEFEETGEFKIQLDILKMYNEFSTVDNIIAFCNFAIMMFLPSRFRKYSLNNLKSKFGEIVYFIDNGDKKVTNQSIFENSEVLKITFKRRLEEDPSFDNNVLNVRMVREEFLESSRPPKTFKLNSIINIINKQDDSDEVKFRITSYSKETLLPTRLTYKVCPWVFENSFSSSTVISKGVHEVKFVDSPAKTKDNIIGGTAAYSFKTGELTVVYMSNDNVNYNKFQLFLSTMAASLDAGSFLSSKILDANLLIRQEAVDTLQSKIGIPLMDLWEMIGLGMYVKITHSKLSSKSVEVIIRILSVTGASQTTVLNFAYYIEPTLLNNVSFGYWMSEKTIQFYSKNLNKNRKELNTFMAESYYKLNCKLYERSRIYCNLVLDALEGNTDAEMDDYFKCTLNYLEKLYKKYRLSLVDVSEIEDELISESDFELVLKSMSKTVENYLDNKYYRFDNNFVLQFDNIPLEIVPIFLEMRGGKAGANLFKEYLKVKMPRRRNYLSFGVYKIMNYILLSSDINTFKRSSLDADYFNRSDKKEFFKDKIINNIGVII